MDDLEITRLCASAMGCPPVIHYHPKLDQPLTFVAGQLYHPLTNDAQAMALVKALRLHLAYGSGTWRVWDTYQERDGTLDPDLNRAICLAVAKMQKEKA